MPDPSRVSVPAGPHPFCESLCYYCACNKIITKKHERGAAYLQALAREVDLYTLQIGLGQPAPGPAG